MAKKLVMAFKTFEGTTSTLTFDEPKDGLTEAEVRTVMDIIIAQNIFNTNSGDLIEVKAAEIITTTTETLI